MLLSCTSILMYHTYHGHIVLNWDSIYQPYLGTQTTIKTL